MNYINLHSTATSENVSEANALTNNFTTIDGCLGAFTSSNAAVSAPVTPVGTTPENGMQVFSKYNPDISGSGSQIWVYDSASALWLPSDQKETWGSWSQLTMTNTAILQHSNIWYKRSSLGRVRFGGNFQFNSSTFTGGGTWQAYHDPAATTVGNRLTWAQYGPNIPSASSPTYIFTGSFDVNSGFTGSNLRYAISKVNISGVDYVKLLFNFNAVTISGSFFPYACINHTYDNGYAGTVGNG